MLPKGPEWKSHQVDPPEGHPVKRPMYLFYRNPVECLQWIIMNPLMQDALIWDPLQIFKDAAHTMRVYTEWLTGDVAWKLKVYFSSLNSRHAIVMGYF